MRNALEFAIRTQRSCTSGQSDLFCFGESSGERLKLVRRSIRLQDDSPTAFRELQQYASLAFLCFSNSKSLNRFVLVQSFVHFPNVCILFGAVTKVANVLDISKSKMLSATVQPRPRPSKLAGVGKIQTWELIFSRNENT